MAGAIGSGNLPHLLLVGSEDVHVSCVLPPLSEVGCADAGPIVLTVLARHRSLPLPCRSCRSVTEARPAARYHDLTGHSRVAVPGSALVPRPTRHALFASSGLAAAASSVRIPVGVWILPCPVLTTARGTLPS